MAANDMQLDVWSWITIALFAAIGGAILWLVFQDYFR